MIVLIKDRTVKKSIKFTLLTNLETQEWNKRPYTSLVCREKISIDR